MPAERVDIPMGLLYIAQSPTVLATGGIGSCVAVCLFHTKSRWGSLAHVMLPKRADPMKVISEEDLRYADAAIAVMLQQFEAHGIPTANLTAKIVGGASMFPDVQGRSVRVGERNVEAIKEILSKNNISILAEEVGGSVGRAVTFDLASGVVSVTMSL